MAQAGEGANGKRIVVSGINGYIATVLGLEILRAGHILVGTSRSPTHEAELRKGPYSDYSDRFVYHHVPDMAAPGAFDAVLAGAHAFLHTASPIASALSFATSITPAVQSVESALASATRAGPQFESFVYMSSIAAVLDKEKLLQDPGYAFTEADWNESAMRTASSAAIDTDQTVSMMTWYSASKVAAERTLFAFGSMPTTTFAVSSIMPAWVYGPPVLARKPVMADHLSMSLRQIFALYSAGKAGLGPESGNAEPYVDVRDVVAMCMWLVEHPQKANGQRFLLAKGAASPSDMWKVIHLGFGGHRESATDENEAEESFGWPENFPSLKSTKAEILLGIKFRGLKDAVLDTCKAFEAAGVERFSE